jgi:hypothetical protein
MLEYKQKTLYKKNIGDLFLKILPIVIYNYYMPVQEIRNKLATKLQRWWRKASGFCAYKDMITVRFTFKDNESIPTPLFYRHVDECDPGTCCKAPIRFKKQYERVMYAANILQKNASPELLRHIERTIVNLYYTGECICNRPPFKAYLQWMDNIDSRRWIYRILAADGITPKIRMKLSYFIQNFLKNL